MKKVLTVISVIICSTSLFSTENLDENVSGSPLYVLSVPKSGTNLIYKAMGLLEIEFLRTKRIDGPGRGWHLYSFVPKDQYNKLEKVFKIANKYIVIVRDPREACISFLNWSTNPDNKESKKISSEWKGLSMRQKLNYLIIGEKPCEQVIPPTEHFTNNFIIARNLANHKLNNVLIVYFEDLVGVRGGGSYEKQFASLKSIVDFVGVKISDEKINYVCDHLYGGTGTFTSNSQKIGKWRNYFTPRHLRVFKRKYNDCLVSLGYEKDANWDVTDLEG